MTPERKILIELDAKRAAQAHRTPVDACPYPFKSEEGLHWIAVWILAGGVKEPSHV